jgi:hypothetical protein
VRWALRSADEALARLQNYPDSIDVPRIVNVALS